MKKFNEVITVEVSVDSIAEMLLTNLNGDFKHRELVAEAIVGRMKNDNSLGYLYNSLNGYSSEIDFQVGDVVGTSEPLREYGYWTPESIEKNDTVRGDVSSAVIVDINPYSNDKLFIKYQVPNKSGSFDFRTKWVNHRSWNKTV